MEFKEINIEEFHAEVALYFKEVCNKYKMSLGEVLSIIMASYLLSLNSKNSEICKQETLLIVHTLKKVSKRCSFNEKN